MHLRLNREIVNETNITKPFEIIELGISRQTNDNSPLPCIRIYFSADKEILEQMNYMNSDNKPVRCVEFKPKGKFTYNQVQQIVKSDFKFCRVITETLTSIEAYVDIYYDILK
jgi:hypothetical protein